VLGAFLLAQLNGREKPLEYPPVIAAEDAAPPELEIVEVFFLQRCRAYGAGGAV